MPALIYIKGREQPVPVLESYDELVGQLEAIDPLHWTTRWIRATFDHAFRDEGDNVVGNAHEAMTFCVDAIAFIGEWKSEPDPPPLRSWDHVRGTRATGGFVGPSPQDGDATMRTEPRAADPEATVDYTRPRPLRPSHVLPEDIEQ